jgi:hypothetical protein
MPSRRDDLMAKCQLKSGVSSRRGSRVDEPAEKSGLNGLLDDPNQLAPNLNRYINGFSPNVRAIIERF